MAAQDAKTLRADLLTIDPELPRTGLEVRADEDLSHRTLCALGVCQRVTAAGEMPRSILRISFDPADFPGIDPATIRIFRVSDDGRFEVVWRSGANIGGGFIWAKVEEPGRYVPIGLPSDRVLLETLRQIAIARRTGAGGADALRTTLDAFEHLLDLGDEAIDALRDRITIVELAYGADRLKEMRTPRGQGFGIVAPPLPGGAETFGAVLESLRAMTIQTNGFPEEQLFLPPDGPRPLPWPPQPEPVPEFRIRPEALPRLPGLQPRLPWVFCLVGGTDWPMYMHDANHTGRAACSAIRSTNVSTLRERHQVAIDGAVNSQPAIVGGKIYVGTMNASGNGVGGILYKIDMTSGLVEGTFAIDDGPARQGRGIACTPAVLGGKVYFSGLNGKHYRVDAATMQQDWVVDLRKRDLAHNQPVDHGDAYATGWSSPLVVNGRVYVGSGEGEHDSFGYVYCIDAETGDVVWLFCTDKFLAPTLPGNENEPNVIPPSHWTGPGLPPDPFVVSAANPPNPGSAPWSSAAYDAGLDRIYIGTGNADPDNPLPDPRYASGMISLDATTGTFEGFFQPSPDDSYRPAADFDVDVPGAPTVFTRDMQSSFPFSQRVVGFGSKNGSYFLLEADGLALAERRQLLPYAATGAPFPNVDPPDNNSPRENKSGVFGTAAINPDDQTLFVGLGGYSGAIDNATTPFVRAMRWDGLGDAWPTAGVNPPRYSLAQPPVYDTPGEAGLTNAVTVNDVVFVGTTKPGLYAFDAGSGLNLWTAPGFGPGTYCLGAAISGSYVVAGTGAGVYIYSL